MGKAVPGVSESDPLKVVGQYSQNHGWSLTHCLRVRGRFQVSLFLKTWFSRASTSFPRKGSTATLQKTWLATWTPSNVWLKIGQGGVTQVLEGFLDRAAILVSGHGDSR